jgi:hypothetical protein
MNRDRIADVIQICIEYSQMHDKPNDHIEAFVAGLRAAGWSDDDAIAVDGCAKIELREAQGRSDR